MVMDRVMIHAKVSDILAPGVEYVIDSEEEWDRTKKVSEDKSD